MKREGERARKKGEERDEWFFIFIDCVYVVLLILNSEKIKTNFRSIF
jgi:hypothetical protein